MDISDIFKLLQNNTNDVDDVKKNYRKTTMQYQNEPELLEQINDAYEQILLHGMKFGTMNMSVDESFSPHCSFAVRHFQFNQIVIHMNKARRYKIHKPSEMMDMLAVLSKSYQKR